MGSKTLVKSLQEYRDELVQLVSKDVIELFDQYCRKGKNISALKLLRKYGIIQPDQKTP